MPHQDPVQAPADARPAFDAQAPLVAPSASTTARDTGSSTAAADRRSAVRVFAWTVAAALVVSGLLEYQGWQIVLRTVPSVPREIPLGDFVWSSLRTFGGALGLGAAFGVTGLLLPAMRRRPWRTFAAGVAIGAASFLGFLAWLTSLAP